MALRELGDAFTHAIDIAPEAGAATIVHVRRFDSIEFAVVLEPEAPLREARRALYVAMNAIGDALAAQVPPEKPVTFQWPDTILIDSGIVGGARLAWPASAPEDQTADWLVVGFQLRTVLPLLHVVGPDGHPLDQHLVKGTSLETEGFETTDSGALIGSFARHLLLHVDTWQERGFTPIGQQYLARLADEKGLRRGIDINGDLLLRRLKAARRVERLSLTDALARPQWIDPKTGEIWL